MGIELKVPAGGIDVSQTGVVSQLTPQLLLQKTMEEQVEKVKSATGIQLPSYYNPIAVNPTKYAEQIQKRRLLWGNKDKQPQVGICLKPRPSVCECETHAKCIMWTCRQTAFAIIHLCGICSANRRMLSVWSRYFKEKYVRNHTDVDVHSFGQPTNNQRNACSFAVWRTLNKQLFGICSHSPRSRMPCSHSHTDVDTP